MGMPVSDLALALRRAPNALWVALALAAGALVGLGVGRFGTSVVMLTVGAFAVIAVAVIAIRSPLTAVGIALVALPLDVYGRLVDKPVPLTVYQLMLVLALGSWALAIWQGREPLPRMSAVDAGMLMLIAAGAWSLPHSLAPGVTIIGIARLVFIAAFVLLVENLPRTRRDVKTLLAVIATVAAAHALLGIAQALVPGFNIGNVHEQGSGWRTLRRVSGLFDDPNYYAGMLSAGFMISAALLLYAKKAREAALWLSVSGLCAIGIVLTFSRTAWVAVAASAFVLAAVAPKRLRGWLLGTGAVLAIVAVMFVAAAGPDTLASRLKSSGDVQGDASVATRFYMAQSMVRMVADDPVWGTGLAAFDREYPLYREVGSSRTIIRPHMLLGGLVVETGTAGALALLLLAGGVVWTLVRRGRRPLWAGEAAAVAGLACMSIQSMFQYYLYFEYLWVFFGLLVAAIRVGSLQEDRS